MANKSEFTTKKEAEVIIRRKKIIERINERMDATDGIEVRTTKDGKRKYYQTAFVEAFKINKGTVSSYYRHEEDIPLELICAISEKTGCSIQYLRLESDAINYEFDTVIQKTGLSEKAIELLIDAHEKSDDYYRPYGEYIDAINYLITECGDFLESFRVAKRHIEGLKSSIAEHITPYGIPEAAVSVAFTTYDLEFNPNYTEGQFKKSMANYQFSVKGSKKRKLKDQELHHLFEHCQSLELFHAGARKYHCSEELTKIFITIENQ